MIHFETLTGSIYHINTDEMTWKREPTNKSGWLLGINEGPLRQLPEIIVGERCILVENKEGLLETIYTSAVQRTWTDA